VGSEEEPKVKIDEEDYAQMSPDKLEKQIKMILTYKKSKRKMLSKEWKQKRRKKPGTRHKKKN
jgi:hypothetical protein